MYNNTQEVDIYEQRPFVGGKVASYKDKDGNHIEMGLHVFFGCYFNLFRLMAKCGVLQNLLLKVGGRCFLFLLWVGVFWGWGV